MPGTSPLNGHARPIELLLVEDNALHAEVTREALLQSDLPVTVHLVRDGEEALDFLFGRGPHAGSPRPDVVLLDLHLPKKDGMEVLAEMRAHDALRKVPVAILTTSDADIDRLRSFALRANAYLTKPPDDRLARFIRIATAIEDCWVSLERLPPWDE